MSTDTPTRKSQPSTIAGASRVIARDIIRDLSTPGDWKQIAKDSAYAVVAALIMLVALPATDLAGRQLHLAMAVFGVIGGVHLLAIVVTLATMRSARKEAL